MKLHLSGLNFLSLIYFFVALDAAGQAEGIPGKIASFNQEFPNEMIYVHFDREIYYPGDTLWFKSYVRDKVTLTDRTVSKSVFIKIVNQEGIIVHRSIYPVFNSEAKGQINLEQALEPGLYHLLAYSSWMKNGQYGELFRKPFEIRREMAGRERFSIRLNKEKYYKGDTLIGWVSLLDRYETELSNVKVEAKIGLIKENEFSLSFFSGAPEAIKFEGREEILKSPVLKLSAVHKGYSFDTVIYLPAPSTFDIGFFPEGGHLIQGVSNRIAFLTNNERGIPVDVKGGLYSSSGEQLSEVQSDYLGMGTFTLIPEVGEHYYLMISDPPHIADTFHLPKSKEDGWVLQTTCNKTDLGIFLSNTYNSPRNALVIVAIRGFMVNYVQRQVDGFDAFSVPIGELPPGIAVVTLFDESGNSVAERLVFIGQEKQCKVQMSTARASYLPRDKVNLEISLRDGSGNPVEGSFSLAVVDKQLCQSETLTEPGIVPYLLLKPEVKGKIHNPDYYFDEFGPEKKYHLDLLLLTQGWRKYRYKQLIDKPLDSIPHFIHQDVVRGQLLQYKYGRKSVPAEGLIKVYNAGGTARFKTDKAGFFNYMHIYHPDFNPNIVLFGEDPDGKSKLEIKLFPDVFEDGFESFLAGISDSVLAWKNYPVRPETRYEDHYSLGINNKWIEEVIIYGKRKPDFDRIENTFMNSSETPKEILKNSLDVYSALLNLGLPIYEEDRILKYHGGQFQGPLDWFVDDFERDYEFVKNLRTEDIESLWIVKFPDTQLYKIPDRAPGEEFSYMLIAIKTKPYSFGSGDHKRRNSVILPKLSMPREFFRPRYETEAERYSQVPDLRKTIHWEPQIFLDESGNAEISFYNADRYTRISCILQGITKEGIPVQSEISYDVTTIRD